MARREEGTVVKRIKLHANGMVREVGLRLIETHGTHNYLYRIREPEFHVENKDVSACIKAAQVEFERISTIAWKPVLVVEIDTTDSWHPREHRIAYGKLELTVCAYEVGTQDGKPVNRHAGYGGINRGDPAREDDATIPDTPGNRVKLEEIRRSMELLATRLADLLGQDKIVKTLANIKVLALPEPKG